MKTANIYSYIENTKSEGPGNRFVIWFQGCLKRCKGCCNEKLLKIEKRNILTIEYINNKIKQAKEKYNIEGVTFLGGEPILQIYAVLDIAKFCKKEGLSTMMFSGYYKHQIEKVFPSESAELFSILDILIDGPFEIDKLDNERRWIGSTNQNIHLFSNKYTENIFYENNIRSIEIRSNNNDITVNGWPINYKRSKQQNGNIYTE